MQSGACRNGVADVSAGQCTVAGQDEVVGGIARMRVPDLAEQVFDTVRVPVAVGGDRDADGMVLVGELGGRVDEGVSAESGTDRFGVDLVYQSACDRTRVGGGLFLLLEP